MRIAPSLRETNGCLPGFSLVEVVLALGLASFALLAVVSLLPVGLKSVQNANEQAGAANVLNALANNLRSAYSSDKTTFENRFADKDYAYVIGGSTVNLDWEDLTLDGSVETATFPKRLSAVLDIYPSADLDSPGRAVISVAWSAQANPAWEPSSQRWTKADGSLTSAIQFLPRP